MKTKNLRLSMLCVALSTVLYSAESMAVIPVTVDNPFSIFQPINQAIDSSANTISNSVDNAKQGIVDAVKRSGRAITDSIKGLMNINVAGYESISKNARTVAAAQEEARVTNEGNFQVPADPCQAAAQVRAFQRVGTLANMGSSGSGAPAGAGPVAKAIINSQDSLSGTPSPAKELKDAYTNHTSEYCSSADAAALKCSASSQTDPVDHLPKQDADANVTTLIGVPAYTPDRQKWAADYLASINQMLPTAGFDKSTASAFGTEAGKAYLSMKNAERAALSVGRNSFSMAYKMRSPGQADGTGLLKDLSPEYAASRNPALPKGVSTMELLEAAVSHYFSQKWIDSNAASAGSPAEKEQMRMAAISLKLQMMQFNQGERMELLLAQIANASTKSMMAPYLAQQHAAAVAGATR